MLTKYTRITRPPREGVASRHHNRRSLWRGEAAQWPARLWIKSFRSHPASARLHRVSFSVGVRLTVDVIVLPDLVEVREGGLHAP